MDNNELLAQISQLMEAQEQRITANLTGKIEELRTETREQITELRTETRAEFSSIHGELSGIHGEISSMHEEISGMHGEISSIHEEISGMHGEISSMHEEISDMQVEMADMRGEIGTLRQAVVQIEGALPKIDIVLEQQVDIINRLKSMETPAREIAALQDQVQTTSGALYIHTHDTTIHVRNAI